MLLCTCVCFLFSSASQLNEVRAQIVDANQRLAAASALLFAKRATALSLQREIKEKEQQVRSALHVLIHVVSQSPAKLIDRSRK